MGDLDGKMHTSIMTRREVQLKILNSYSQLFSITKKNMNLFLLFEDQTHKSVGEADDQRLIGKHHTFSNQKPKRLSLSTTILWKCVFFIMALFFMAAAYVQHNDPDPYLWMPAYLVPMFINIILIIWLPFDRCENQSPFSFFPPYWNSTGSVWKWLRSWKFLNKVIAIHSAYCYTLGIWTLLHFAWRHLTSAHNFREGQDIMLIESWVSEQNMLMEEAKELLGLCLVIAWLSFLQNGTFLRFGKKGIYFGAFLTSLPIVAWVLVEKFEAEKEQCL